MATKIGSRKFGIFDVGTRVPGHTLYADKFELLKDGVAKFSSFPDGVPVIATISLEKGQWVKEIVESLDSKPSPDK